MYITLTQGKTNPEQTRLLNEFLADFLPRMERETEALAAYHYDRPERGDGVTVVIWPSAQAAEAYRKSELIKEVQAFSERHGLEVIREGYPLSYPAPRSD
jgi:hypothetical protein